MPGVNETRPLVQHESYECKCRLREWKCMYFKTKLDHNECRCDCKESDNWVFLWKVLYVES